ncbi:type IV secretion system protein VirB7 [Bartonella sp. cb54]|uniref:type IV secretion system protein VirB7 n=1 Tax=Bartonella sp. cb54 TaxID=3385560 RepID=UPI0039A4E4D3
MKLKITVAAFCTIALTGCASLSGPKKPPRCNGQNTRALNKDKWNWHNQDIILQEQNVKPITTPIILNTLESEKTTANVAFNTASSKSVNHEVPLKITEVAHEK